MERAGPQCGEYFDDAILRCSRPFGRGASRDGRLDGSSAMDARTSRYHEAYARWQRDPQGFWAEAAQAIDWIEPAKQVFDPSAGVYGRWFAGGVCNTCWNAVDRHVLSGRGEQPAIVYDSPLAGQERTISYHRLQVETQVLAAILRNFGVAKGDRVVLYMPMVPEAV